MPTFDGSGNVNRFINRMECHLKVKKLEGEEAAAVIASRLEEPAFNVYMRLSTNDKKDVDKIKKELRRQYDTKKKIDRRSYAPTPKKNNFSIRSLWTHWLETLFLSRIW